MIVKLLKRRRKRRTSIEKVPPKRRRKNTANVGGATIAMLAITRAGVVLDLSLKVGLDLGRRPHRKENAIEGAVAALFPLTGGPIAV